MGSIYAVYPLCNFLRVDILVYIVMSDIQLIEEDEEFPRPVATNSQPLFVRLVLATGLVKTEEQANYVLVGGASLLLILAFFIWYSTSPSSSAGVNPQNATQLFLMKEQSQEWQAKHP